MPLAVKINVALREQNCQKIGSERVNIHTKRKSIKKNKKVIQNSKSVKRITLIPHNFFSNHYQFHSDVSTQNSCWGSLNITLLFPMKTGNTVTWLNITWYWDLSFDKHDNNVQNTWWVYIRAWQKEVEYESNRTQWKKNPKYYIIHMLQRSVFRQSVPVSRSHRLKMNNNLMWTDASRASCVSVSGI